MYQPYNPNPMKQRVGDCTIRAICKATGKSWDEVYIGTALQGYIMANMADANAVWGAYLKRLGYKREIVPDTCPDCYTVSAFAEDHPRGTYILALSGHVVCVSDGDYYDAWDSGNEIPIYYWFKEE